MLQSSRFRWLRPGVLTLSKYNNTEVSLSSWIAFYCLLIFHNTVRVSGSVHYSNMYPFFIIFVDVSQTNCILCPFKILISSVVKQRVFCGFPKTFHLCFCDSRLVVSLLSDFHCRIAECVLLFVVVCLRILHGLRLDYVSVICKNNIYLFVMSFLFPYDSVHPKQLYMFFCCLLILILLLVGSLCLNAILLV